MNHAPLRLTLALAPTARGLGYVLFQDETTLLDWGVKEVRCDKNPGCISRADDLVRRFRPAMVVLEDARAEGSRRRQRVRRLLDVIAHGARRRGCEVALYPRTKILSRFAGWGDGSKDDRASAVAAMLPALAPRLPRRRRIWESEHYSMAIFEAGALGITHFAETRHR